MTNDIHNQIIRALEIDDDTLHKAWPVVIIQDRYNGTYTGGLWIAVAQYDELAKPHVTRSKWVEETIQGNDDVASNFGPHFNDKPWVAVGDTPDQALAALYYQCGVAHHTEAPENYRKPGRSWV